MQTNKAFGEDDTTFGAPAKRCVCSELKYFYISTTSNLKSATDKDKKVLSAYFVGQGEPRKKFGPGIPPHKTRGANYSPFGSFA